MKKINNKGIGHHLLLMVVAVVAVIGAAGYFVWQRQQDDGIDAKAAEYNYQGVASIGMGGGYGDPEALFLACSQKTNRANTYTLNVKLVSTVSGATGTIKSKNKIIQKLSLNGPGSTFASKALNGSTVLTFEGTYTISTGVVIPLLSGTFTLQDLIPCDYFTVSKNYSYTAQLADSVKNTLLSPNLIGLYACKVPSNDGFILDLKYTSTATTFNSYIVQQYINQEYVAIAGGRFSGSSPVTWFNWPRKALPADAKLGFSGYYLDSNFNQIKLFGSESLTSIESLNNCQ